MSSQGNSNAVDFDPPGVIHSVIPTDPTSMVSSVESDARQKLLEKERIITDLKHRVYSLTAAYRMAYFVVKTVLEENVKLSQERVELVATMKNLGRDFSKKAGMDSAKGISTPLPSNAVDFDPPGEIHLVIPTDPTSMVSYVESDTPSLRQKLLEKDRIIRDLEHCVSSLTVASTIAHSVINTAFEENVKLSQERVGLVATMKKLGRDFSRVKLSMGRDLLPANAENVGQVFSRLKLLLVRRQLSANLLMLDGDFSKQPETIDIGTCEQSVPKAYPDTVISTAGSSRGYSAAVSPKKTSHATSPTKLPYDGRSSISVQYSSSQQSSAANSPPRGQSVPGHTPKIDGREFFLQARSRLSFQQYSACFTIIQEVNAQKQTREEALRKADEILGSLNKDLYLCFQGLLYQD